jgi:hypothetical protein
VVPPKIMTEPSPSCAVVGYQRGCAISGPSVHELAAGSKTVVLATPLPNTPWYRWPPAMNTRPSGSTLVPEQKMSRW